MEQRQRKAQYRQHKKQLLLINTLLSIVLAVSVVFTGVLGILAYIGSDLRQGHISDNHEDLGISSDVASKLPKGVVNIALFGLDTRSYKVENDPEKALTGRSDSMIILSINTNNNTIKLTSILRDSWVKLDLEKYNGYNKINAAYAYGGAQGAVRTLNQNFGLNITDYVSVSLRQLEKIINILGGIDVEITALEKRRINELSNEEGFQSELLTSTGLVHLNGTQALAYSRIRDDSDEIRVLRQQKVLSCLFEKAKSVPIAEYPEKIKSVLSICETSLSYDEIFSYATTFLKISDLHLQHTSVPGSEVVGKGGIFEDTRGGWVWKYDMDKAKEYIYSWIYG